MGHLYHGHVKNQRVSMMVIYIYFYIWVRYKDHLIKVERVIRNSNFTWVYGGYTYVHTITYIHTCVYIYIPWYIPLYIYHETYIYIYHHGISLYLMGTINQQTSWWGVSSPRLSCQMDSSWMLMVWTSSHLGSYAEVGALYSSDANKGPCWKGCLFRGPMLDLCSQQVYHLVI